MGDRLFGLRLSQVGSRGATARPCSFLKDRDSGPCLDRCYGLLRGYLQLSNSKQVRLALYDSRALLRRRLLLLLPELGL
jgi:hypothetical protein